jgi:hypothetical protein
MKVSSDDYSQYMENHQPDVVLLRSLKPNQRNHPKKASSLYVKPFRASVILGAANSTVEASKLGVHIILVAIIDIMNICLYHLELKRVYSVSPSVS